MEEVIGSLTCDMDNGGDDDSTDNDDDGNEFWHCLQAKDGKECKAEHCDWCTTKGGFGMCLTDEAAEIAKDSYWFECDHESQKVAAGADNNFGYWTPVEFTFLTLEDEDDENDTSLDATCTTGGNTADACGSVTDARGDNCAWCRAVNVVDFVDGTVDVCVSQSRAKRMEEIGASCDFFDNHATTTEQHTTISKKLQNPYDPSCIMATITGGMEKSACIAASDYSGEACEWCSSSGHSLCLTSEQAQVAEQVLGARCDDDDTSVAVADPFDTACLIVTFGMDESACLAATDSDGNPCEWCTVVGYTFCLNAEQSETVEEFGASCDTAASALESEEQIATSVDDPLDTACLIASIMGGMTESACLAATDSDGNSCEWCTFGGYSFCLNDEQGTTVQEFGASCDTASSALEEQTATNVDDPFDTACLIAGIIGGMTESACLAAIDSDGNSCEWCTFGGYSFCLNDEQGSTVEEFGASCDDGTATSDMKKIA